MIGGGGVRKMSAAAAHSSTSVQPWVCTLYCWSGMAQ